MIDLSGTHHDNKVSIDDTGIIVVTVRGPQNRESIRKLVGSVRVACEELRAEGKKVKILTDMSEIRRGEVTSGARQESRTALTTISFDQAAVFAKNGWGIVANYFLRLTGKSKETQVFTNRKKALAWLHRGAYTKAGRPVASLVIGLVIMIIGIAALVGWVFDNSLLAGWSPRFRPMNPLAALGLIGGGAGFVSYWAGKLLLLRWTAGFGVLLGIAALTPLPIDEIFFGEQVATRGVLGHLADSAAICFIAMGVSGLIARRKGRWVHPIEYTAVVTVAGLALFNIFGQLYGRDRFYEWAPHFAMAYNLAVAFLIAAIGLLLLIIYRKTNINVLRRFTRISWMIVIVLLLVQVATYGSWLQATQRAEVTAATTFDANVEDIEAAINNRITAYTNALYGFQGLFLASSGVNQGEFEAYYKTTNVAENYPGLRALSFISKVKDKDLNAFVQAQRQDKSLHPQGNPTFTILQRANSEDHYIVTYVADSSTVGGTDFASNPVRLAAYKKAEATGKPVASGTIEFAATPTSPAQTGFFITVPIARDNDPRHVIGFVNAVFNYENFFSDTLTEAVALDKLLITIKDTADNKEVFRSDKTNGQRLVLNTEKTISVADRTWFLNSGAPRRYISGDGRLPAFIFLGGQVFSILLIVIFWIQFRGRQQALDLADDITEDLQEERNRAVANDRKSRAILASIGDGVFVVDMKQRITMLNPVAQELTGVSEAEALGKQYTDVLRFEFEKNQKRNSSFIEKALKGAVSDMGPVTMLIKRDGTRIAVADSAAPIRDANGNLTGAIVVFRDISKEHDLDKAKTEFVSLASHQLRTPLSAINWYSQMLLGGDAGKLTKVQHEYIKEIFEGSQRMSDLVNSLLDVSRLELGKLPSQPVPTSMQAIIRDIEKELAVIVKGRQLNLTIDLQELSMVTADPKQLRIIAQNLMSNAVKYSNMKGEISVTFRLATEEDMKQAKLRKPGAFWFFSVVDNGYGIPAKQQSKIFGKLFRADNVRKLDVEGTGLGLYIVKEVVDKMGGKVWFTSTEGKGAAFYVVAPMTVKATGKDV